MTGVETLVAADYTETIGYIIAQASQFVILSGVIVWLVNQLKWNLPSILKPFMWLLAIGLGIWSLFLMNAAFAMWLDTYKTIFFGFVMGMSSVGLYEAWLGKKWNKVETIEGFDLSQ